MDAARRGRAGVNGEAGIVNGETGSALETADGRAGGGVLDYVRIGRPDHWLKHVIIAPGVILAAVLAGPATSDIYRNILIGLVSACLVASANYTINEWLDAEFDRHHPVKRSRPGAVGNLRASLVMLQYCLLATVGIGLSIYVSKPFFVTTLLFLGSGIVYNVRPFRTKDVAYVDILSEALNNPIRFLLGWFMWSATTFPPLSIVFSMWFGGAFLMAAKRLAEFRQIVDLEDADVAGRYRRSFKFYTNEVLIKLVFLYSILSTFFITVFLIKYKDEFIFVFPGLAILFYYCLHIGLKANSPAQAPERLLHDRTLVLILLLIGVSFVVFSFVEIPGLGTLLHSRFTELRFPG